MRDAVALVAVGRGLVAVGGGLVAPGLVDVVLDRGLIDVGRGLVGVGERLGFLAQGLLAGSPIAGSLRRGCVLGRCRPPFRDLVGAGQTRSISMAGQQAFP